MALPKRKSRKILIDGEIFQYKISRSKVAEEGVFELTLTAQNLNSNGPPLIAKGLKTRDYWLDFGDAEKYPETSYQVITTKNVEMIIRSGLKQGWKSEQKSGIFELNLNE